MGYFFNVFCTHEAAVVLAKSQFK